jgi:N-acetylmuramoyl-L-alanine amidase
VRAAKAFLLFLVFLNSAAPAFAFMIRGPQGTVDAPEYDIRGTGYIPLISVCSAYGARWDWDPVAKIVNISSGGSSLRFRVGEYRVYANGAISTQERPVAFWDGIVCVPENFLKTVFSKFFAPGLETGEAPPRHLGYYRIRRVALDAGHGGKDPGAIGRDGIKERYITLDIAKKVGDILEAEGIQVTLTRSSDKFLELQQRVDTAHEAEVDLFVSIHANASVARRLKGAEVYYLSEAVNDSERAEKFSEDPGDLEAILTDLELTEYRRDSVELAGCIINRMGGRLRGIKNARFYVLKEVRMPAVLVEVGYISNSGECSKLGWSEYRGKVAAQIAEGIMDYKNRFEATNGFTD